MLIGVLASCDNDRVTVSGAEAGSSGTAGAEAGGSAGTPASAGAAGGNDGPGGSQGTGGATNAGATGEAGSSTSGGTSGASGASATGGAAPSAGATSTAGAGSVAGASGTSGNAGSSAAAGDIGAGSAGLPPSGGAAGASGASGAAGVGIGEDTGGVPNTGGSAGRAGNAGTAGLGEPPATIGGLTVSSTPDDLEIDLFGVAGHRVWIEATEEQVTRMNQERYGDGSSEDIYVPSSSAATYADHVLVEDYATNLVADYGKLEVKLVGESTGRDWTSSTIPNVRVDADEFQEGMRIGGVEHLRLNNAQVGTIFREHIAHRIYRELGYPALDSTYAFLGSSVWGEDVWVPMVLLEVYKCRTMSDREDDLGGSCVNMWEFPGELGHYGIPEDACQERECDDTRLEELGALLSEVPRGPGFMDALSDYVDWDMYHRYQCMSWIMWTGDDPIHNYGNNNLIIERDDGRMVWAPYSIDISAGQDWYQNTTLTGETALPMGCQSDPLCWADTIATCEGLIDQFQNLHPEGIVDETEILLTELGMMRSGDEERARTLRQWYVDRQAGLLEELERYRHLPDELGNCPDDLQNCGGWCGTAEQCAEACAIGSEWCEAFGYCIDPYYEYCPACEGDNPVYCGLLDSCVPSAEDCFISCDVPGEIYCEWMGTCTSEEYCFGLEQLPYGMPAR